MKFLLQKSEEKKLWSYFSIFSLIKDLKFEL